MKTVTSKSHRFALACMAALATSVVAATAVAAPVAVSPDGALSVQVRFDDLNLATEQGTLALYHRISNAARQVCPDRFVRDLSRVAAAEKCQAEAVSRAVQGLNNPQLAAVLATYSRHG